MITAKRFLKFFLFDFSDQKRRRRTNRKCEPLRLESLEDRNVPASFSVPAGAFGLYDTTAGNAWTNPSINTANAVLLGDNMQAALNLNVTYSADELREFGLGRNVEMKVNLALVANGYRDNLTQVTITCVPPAAGVTTESIQLVPPAWSFTFDGYNKNNTPLTWAPLSFNRWLGYTNIPTGAQAPPADTVFSVSGKSSGGYFSSASPGISMKTAAAVGGGAAGAVPGPSGAAQGFPSVTYSGISSLTAARADAPAYDGLRIYSVTTDGTSLVLNGCNNTGFNLVQASGDELDDDGNEFAPGITLSDQYANNTSSVGTLLGSSNIWAVQDGSEVDTLSSWSYSSVPDNLPGNGGSAAVSAANVTSGNQALWLNFQTESGNDVCFLVTPASSDPTPPSVPQVTGLSSVSGLTGGGSTITINGSGFTGASSVMFGSVAATSFTVNSENSITATVPAQGVDTVDVTVTNSNGVSFMDSADQFSYINAAPSGADETVTTAENGFYTFGTSDFNFSDSGDSPANDFAAVEITTVPTGGTLTDHGTTVNAGDVIGTSDISAGDLIYTPATGQTGSDSLPSRLKMTARPGTVAPISIRRPKR